MSRNDPNPAFMGEQLLKFCMFLKSLLDSFFFRWRFSGSYSVT